MTTPVVGQAVPRTEARRFVTGQGCYVDDIRRPGMLHAVVVRSPVAHALIADIQTEIARQMPGVVAIYTYGDVAAWLKPIPQRVCPLPGMEHYAQLPIAHDRVRYVGEPIALVVAHDRYLAEDAAEAVVLDYEQLPVVTEAEVAAGDKVLLHPDKGSNLATDYHCGFGDVDGAFQNAARIFQERFYVHRHSAVALETRGLCAEWDSALQHLTVWGATKVPFANRAILSDMLGLTSDQVDLLEVDVGGSFGVRGDFYPEDFLVPFAARQLAAPVKWIEDRRENLMASNHSRECWCELAIALDEKGCILGMRGHWLSDIGAYVRTNSGVMPGKGTQFLPGPYRVPATGFHVQAVCTNKTPAGTYRGPGRYESTFFRERLLDVAAESMGIDPVEIRRRNLIPTESLPYDAGALVPNMAPTIYDSGDYLQVLNHALAAFDYTGKQHLNGRCIDGWHHGIGLGCFVESTGGGPGEGARLELRREARFDLFVGASSAGQGQETSMAQILADALEIPLESITVRHGSTNLLQTGFGAYHSRSAVMAGNATAKVAQAMRQRILAVATEQSGLTPEDLRYERGVVYDRDNRTVTDIEQISASLPADNDPLSRGPLSVEDVFMHNELTYTFGVQLAHVAVNTRTSQVKVLDFYSTEDIGRIINPEIVHGQSIGAAVQGLGGTFLDQFVYDEHGQLLTGNLADYLLPLASDFPVLRGETLALCPSPGNPLGVKGAGEGGIIATGAALANAVSQALRPLNVSITQLPISMNNLGRWLRQARDAGIETMKVDGKHTLAAPRDRVWQALLDPEVLKASIPGCESIDQAAENEYHVTLKTVIGPIKARVNAVLRLTDIQAPTSYTLNLEGNAGAAGFARGAVHVTLDSKNENSTELRYHADGQLGGKLAQVGSRLVEGVVAKIANEFFDRFQQEVAPESDDATPRSSIADTTPGVKPKPTYNRYVGIALAALAAIAVVIYALA